MRTKTEAQLMNLRQAYRDYLIAIRAMPVIPLELYKRVYVRFMTCEAILVEYRLNHKQRDIA